MNNVIHLLISQWSFFGGLLVEHIEISWLSGN